MIDSRLLKNIEKIGINIKIREYLNEIDSLILKTAKDGRNSTTYMFSFDVSSDIKDGIYNYYCNTDIGVCWLDDKSLLSFDW